MLGLCPAYFSDILAVLFLLAPSVLDDEYKAYHSVIIVAYPALMVLIQVWENPVPSLFAQKLPPIEDPPTMLGHGIRVYRLKKI